MYRWTVTSTFIFIFIFVVYGREVMRLVWLKIIVVVHHGVLEGREGWQRRHISAFCSIYATPDTRWCFQEHHLQFNWQVHLSQRVPSPGLVIVPFVTATTVTRHTSR
jgi:hypothetical protein